LPLLKIAALLSINFLLHLEAQRLRVVNIFIQNGIFVFAINAFSAIIPVIPCANTLLPFCKTPTPSISAKVGSVT
jgi:hypothetical protein